MKTIALCVSAAVVSAAACGRDIYVESTDLANGTVSLSFGAADGFESGALYVSYGVAPGGATTNGWDHTEKLADIAESDSSYVAAIPDGFGSSYSALRFFLFTRRQAGSGDYAADGLYAQWDGIDNAGSGSHSDTASTWANLADPGIMVGYSLGGEAQFTENAFRSVSQNSYFQLANAASWWQGIGDNSTWEAYVTPGKGWTTERSSAAGIMGAHWTPGCNGVVFGQIGRGSGNSINFCVCKSQEGGVGSIDLPFSAVSEGVAMHIAYVVTPTSSSVYTNGALFASVVAQMPLPLGEATFNIGAAFASADRGFEGDIHAIRVYSRALGADEIATNRDIDEMRFASNGDGMVETVSHSGTIVDSQVPVIEYAGRVETFSRKVSIPVGVVSFGSGANRCDLYADYGVSAQALTKTRLLAEGLAEDSVDAVIAGLEPETTYYARVYAKNASGESAALETISFTTAPEPPETYGSGRTISVVATNITAGAVTVTLELGDPGEDTAEYGLFAAWGGTPGGNAISGWSHMEKIADVCASDTRFDYTFPEGWGSDVLAVRFFLRDTLVGAGYTPYEYIAFDGSSISVPTGIVPDGHHIHIEWITAGAVSNYGPLFGDRLNAFDGGKVRVLECYGYSGDNNMRLSLMDGTGAERFANQSDLGTDCFAVFGGSYRTLDYGVPGTKSDYAVFVDGVEISDAKGAAATGVGELVIFSDPFAYAQAFTGHVRSFWMKDRDGDYAARYFPAVRDSDGAPGFYDGVTGGFATSAGGGLRADAAGRIEATDVSSSGTINWNDRWASPPGLLVVVR